MELPPDSGMVLRNVQLAAKGVLPGTTRLPSPSLADQEGDQTLPRFYLGKT